ncbi:EAL domain-containing protein [Brevibacillus centrosporus]|uniref:EAL domain-containing protein n=1 Tax=Brevibacillus centrosporus TaxID=54910 RepID=UPI003D263C23
MHFNVMTIPLVPYFQTIIDVKTNEVIGKEATIKGKHDGQIIHAGDLFASARDSNKVAILDHRARGTSLELGFQSLQANQRLFMNMSAESLLSTRNLLNEKCPLDRITLEITEQTPYDLPEETLSRINYLRSRGMQIALDDFGVGWNNLNLVDILTPDYLKLDKSFIASKRTDTIKTVLYLCESKGIKLIVEGVETAEQRDILLNLGVRYMQGYYFGYPAPLEHSVKQLSV